MINKSFSFCKYSLFLLKTKFIMAFCFDGDIFTEQNRSKLSYYEFRLRYFEFRLPLYKFRLRYYEVEMPSRSHEMPFRRFEMPSRRRQMPFRYDNKGL